MRRCNSQRYSSWCCSLQHYSSWCCYSKCYSSPGKPKQIFFSSFYLTLATSRIFEAPPVSHVCEKESFETHLLQDTSFRHLVSLFLAPLISALLVGRGVITQVPSSSNNNNNAIGNINKKNSRTQSQKKSITFDIKQQRVVFLELNYKERNKA